LAAAVFFLGEADASLAINSPSVGSRVPSRGIEQGIDGDAAGEIDIYNLSSALDI
jgi:hypothetical protein